MNTGIYAIKNLMNGKMYIGSTMQPFKKRWGEHRACLRGDYHANGHLQCAWNKYGEGNFDFVVIERIGDAAIIIEREQYWLDLCRANGGVYNFGDCAEAPWLGRCHTEEELQKMSDALTGRCFSDKHRQRLSVAAKKRDKHSFSGKRHTKETRRRISAARKGIVSWAKPYPSFLAPDGTIYPAGTNLASFCREHSLLKQHMYKVVAGKRKTHRGWRLAS